MYLLLPPTVTYLSSTFSPLRPLRHSLDTYLYLTITPHVCTPPTNTSGQTHILLGAMPKTENTKKAAGNAKKAEAAAAKQAAEDQKRAAAESKEWSKGAKDNSKA